MSLRNPQSLALAAALGAVLSMSAASANPNVDNIAGNHQDDIDEKDPHEGVSQ